MGIPNGEQATVTDENLLRYVLNPAHPVGGSHARLFDLLLGINLTCADVLRTALLHAAQSEEATLGKSSSDGYKFEVRFPLKGPRGSYNVLRVWMIKSGTDVPELVTALITT